MRPLAGFYTRDPAAIRQALQRLADPKCVARSRVVKDPRPYSEVDAAHAEGLWSEAFFGPAAAPLPDHWAVIEREEAEARTESGGVVRALEEQLGTEAATWLVRSVPVAPTHG